MKLKINTEGLKAFFINNVEKLAMLAGIACVVAAVFFAVRQETLPEAKQSAQLNIQTARAKKAVTEAGHTPLPPHNFSTEVQTGYSTADGASYDFPAMWTTPLKEEKIKRGEPTLLAVEKPHGTPGYGAFAMKKTPTNPKRSLPLYAVDPAITAIANRPKPRPVRNDEGQLVAAPDDAPAPPSYNAPVVMHGTSSGGDTVPTGFRWICVTGLVPVAAQEEEYASRFKHAMRPQGLDQGRDRPKYVWYKFEREEIGPDGSVIQSDPKVTWELSLKWRKDSATWDGSAQDVIAQEYTLQPLTGPLGPLMLKDWDYRVGHPNIPYLPGKGPPMAVQGKPAEETAPAPVAATETAGTIPGMGDAGDTPQETRPDNGPKVITHKLFRFFDYSVEPEKKYRYRVSLMLDNPNYINEKTVGKATAAQSARYLERPESAKEQYRDSTPSEWTDWITVPPDHRVLVAGLRPSGKGEPIARVLAVGWDNANALETTMEFDMMRGDVADWPGIKSNEQKKLLFLDPTDHLIKPMAWFDFMPKVLLLDIRGGGISGNNGPVELLFSDMRGNLSIRSDERDKAEVKVYNEMTSSSSDNQQDTTTPGGGHGGPRTAY